MIVTANVTDALTIRGTVTATVYTVPSGSQTFYLRRGSISIVANGTSTNAIQVEDVFFTVNGNQSYTIDGSDTSSAAGGVGTGDVHFNDVPLPSGAAVTASVVLAAIPTGAYNLFAEIEGALE